MKIVVLAGGLSTERLVALTSGTGVCRALRERGHKAILVDAEKNLIAFPGEDRYYVYGYDDETGFTQKGVIALDGENWDYDLRGLYVGEVFYVVGGGSVIALDLNNLTELGRIDIAG